MGFAFVATFSRNNSLITVCRASPEIVLKFADGSTSYADILVGADGIRSTVRREVICRLAARREIKLESESPSAAATVMDDKETSHLVEPVWSGTLVYRSLILLAALEKRFPGHRAGRGPVVVCPSFILFPRSVIILCHR